MEKESDGWFGPEVRPVNAEDIVFYEHGWSNDEIFWQIGTYYTSLNEIEQARDHWVPWKNVYCWKSANPGPIPERFKKQD